MQDTICAISTPQGIGGIAVVRISGEKAVDIVDSLFRGRNTLQDAAGYSIHYGTISDLDDVLVSVFRAPHSFTGEDCVEISCHGSLYIQQELLRLLCQKGCRLARAGEFTERAFLNGKMDLSQAEAVADIIAAESRAAHNLARTHLKGCISQRLSELRAQLLHFTSLIELELDFADHEELEFADRGELMALADEIASHLKRLTDSFRQGNAIRNGVPVAIIGPTNAGKSTLLNALVGEERAIVSNIHGTTRDTIEDTITLQGIRFRFIDTAGLRQTDDEIEHIGQVRSKKAATDADIILLVLDSGGAETPEQMLHGIDLTGKQVITLYNKADLLPAVPQTTDPNTLYISAKNHQLSSLVSLLTAGYLHLSSTDTLISNARHYEALNRALSAIEAVKKGLDEGLSGEFLSMDLQDCLHALGEITGEITSGEVLNNIFAHFCIGK